MKKRQTFLFILFNCVLLINLISSSFALIPLGANYSDIDYTNIPEQSDYELLSLSRKKIYDLPDNQMFYFSSPAIDKDGNIYVGSSHKFAWFAEGNDWSEHYFLYSFGAGPAFNLRWRFDVGPNIVMGGPVINPQGLIFFVASGYNITNGEWPINRNLYALNSDGNLNWSYPLATNIEEYDLWGGDPSCPALDNMGNVYAHGLNFHYSFHWNNGSVRWKNDSDGHPGSPSVYNDTVYFTGRELSAYYVNGTSKWNLTSSDFYPKHKISFGRDGTIYYGSENHTLYAVNPNGTLRWSLYLTDGMVRASPAIDRAGILYIGTKHNDLSELFAIYPDGTIKWRKTPFHDLYGTPAIGSDNRLYFGAEGQKFYVIDKDNGDVLNSLALESDATWCSAVIDEGYIFIGDMNGNLFAFYKENLELSNEPWPCMGGNPQRTGIGDDLRPPSIMNVNHTPSNPTNETCISICADIVDRSGIQFATCFYRVNSGTWINNGMYVIQPDTFQTHIGKFNTGDEIDYYVEALDRSLKANYYKNDNSSNYYTITIISETVPETNSASIESFYHFCIYTLFITVVLIFFKNKFRNKK